MKFIEQNQLNWFNLNKLISWLINSIELLEQNASNKFVEVQETIC